jgi:hypothetical protein
MGSSFEVRSSGGLEGVFGDSKSAHGYADELRGVGARRVVVVEASRRGAGGGRAGGEGTKVAKTGRQVEAEIERRVAACAVLPTPPSITAEDARIWGREAHGMGLTLERALEDIAQCGCPERLFPEVRSAYDAERRRAIHREG